MKIYRLIILFLFLCRLTPLEAAIVDSTNIPLVIIDTKGIPILDEPKVGAVMKIIDNGPGKMNHPGDSPAFNGPIGIEYRGSFSQYFPQKSYGFETRDASGNSLNVSLLGFPEENDWILLAHYNDKSFVRNTLAYTLFREMGHYASRTKFCEVIVNNQYMGVFTLLEKIKRDKNRVNIKKMDPTDIAGNDLTGGYIFKIDNMDGELTWDSEHEPPGYPAGSVKFIYYYPKATDITIEQKNYLKAYIDEFENVIFGSNYTDANNGYKKYIDVTSFVDYFIMGELTRNIDAYKKSCYYNKENIASGGFIHAGPLWDFDWAWKNFAECFEYNMDGSGWAYKIFDCGPYPVPPAWMTRLISDKTFADNCHDRYFQLRKNILSNERIFNYIDSIETLLNDPQKRHFGLWNTLGKKPCTYIGGDCQILGTPEIDSFPTTFHGEVEKLKNWISLRLDFLDQNMIGTATLTPYIYDSQTNGILYRMFPNPCTDIFYIESPQEISEVQIFDLDGKLQLIKNNINNYISSIDVSTLKKNFYIVRIYFKSGEVSNAKLIINL